MLKETIIGPMVWKGSDLSRDTSWIVQLSREQISALGNALSQFKASGKPDLAFSARDFPLPSWQPLLGDLAEELEEGRGFCVMRGLPVDEYCEADIRIILYGIGLHLGTPVRQNPKGDLLGAVTNVADSSDKNARVYETNAHLPFHTDPSDVVGLLCLRKARTGGMSSLTSVASIFNEMLRNHPDDLKLFFSPWYYAHLGEDLPSLSPLFSYHEGKLAFRYLRQYIELGHEIMEKPLYDREIKALDRFDAIAQDPAFHLDMMLEPGDLQWANNYTVMHSRTGFEDHDALEKRRKMLRLWLKMPNARKLAKNFPGRNGFPAPGEQL